MKKTSLFIVLCFIVISPTNGQTPEFPPEQPVNPLTMDEILNDKAFMEIYRQRASSDTSIFQPPLVPDLPSFFVPPVTPSPVSVPPQPPSRQLMDFALQQLEQLDRHKNVLLNDLRNAETCGYHATKFESAYASLQSDFRSRRYVPSSSRLDWAIHGDGFFVLRRQREEADADEATHSYDYDTLYTRAGRFELTDDRKLCLKRNGDTFLLQPETEVAIFADSDTTKCQLARFTHPERLWRIDGVVFMAEHNGEKPEMFSPSEASGTTICTQEYEASNVDVAETLQVYRALHKMQSVVLDSVAF